MCLFRGSSGLGWVLFWISLTAGLVPGHAWRSELYPPGGSAPGGGAAFSGRLIQDFSYAGYRRGEAELPAVTAPVFQVDEYGADASGERDSTEAVQSAIRAAEAAGGGVVRFAAGTYRLSLRGNQCLLVHRDGVVLRGAGTAATRLLNTTTNMRNHSILRFQSFRVEEGPGVLLTGDLRGPARRLPVAEASQFAVGDRVVIRWEFTEEWIEARGQSEYWNAAQRPGDARYHREVTAVDPEAGWIEVDIPTRYTLLRRDRARVSRIGGRLRGCGVEDLSLGNVQQQAGGWGESDHALEGSGAYAAHNSWAIRFDDALDSWITNVRSFQPEGNESGCHLLSNGIMLKDCSRMTVRDCKFERPQYGGGGGNGYMLRLSDSGDCLVDAFEADFSRHGIVLSLAGATGNVFYRCVDRNTGRATGLGGSYETGGRSSDHHMHFSHSNLFDNCVAEDSYYSAAHRRSWGGVPHALAAAHTVFWNTRGEGGRFDFCVESKQGDYGYVIGTRGLAAKARVDLENEYDRTTAPEDHVEGLGEGAGLEPESLYLDQLARRLGAVGGNRFVAPGL